MRIGRQIRTRWKELAALLAIMVTGLVVGAYILSNQRLPFPWVETYTLNAELSTAQAITPGQGQVVAVAGVTVGEVKSVRLEQGRAIVELSIKRDKLPAVHEDARILVRPKTGLQDMAIQLDPGDTRRRRLRDGEAIPLAATRPSVNLEEVLAALDGDARHYLQMTVQGLGKGLGGRGRDLRAVLRAGAPTLESTERVTDALRDRDRELRRVVGDLRKLAGAAASRDGDVARLVETANTTLSTVARRDRDVREAITRLPRTLGKLDRALEVGEPFAKAIRPAADALRPAVRDVGAVLPRVDPLLRDATPAVRRLRPLVRDARPIARTLRPTLDDLRGVTPDLTKSFRVLTRVVNELGHNPDGPEEGYLFWLAWFAHNANSLLSVDDAQGVAWRGALMLSCSSYGAIQAAAPLLAAVAAAPVCPEDASEEVQRP